MDRSEVLVKRLDHLRERLNTVQVSKPSVIHEVNLHRGNCLNWGGLLRAGYYDSDRLDRIELYVKEVEQFLVSLVK